MCRGKTQDEILSFRAEPFLTSQFQSGLLFPNQFYFQSQCFQKEEYSNPPLSPPPRA